MWKKIHLSMVIPENWGIMVVSFLLPSFLSPFNISPGLGMSVDPQADTSMKMRELSETSFSTVTQSSDFRLITASWLVKASFLSW